MSYSISLRHQQRAELYDAARYLDLCDEKAIEVDPAYYRACATLCIVRLKEAPSLDLYRDLLRHSDAFKVLAKNLEYDQMLGHYRDVMYPELDDLMSRFENPLR